MCQKFCARGHELLLGQTAEDCPVCEQQMLRWSDKLQDMEAYPYLSVSWEEEQDGSAAFEKMPDRLMHF